MSEINLKGIEKYDDLKTKIKLALENGYRLKNRATDEYVIEIAPIILREAVKYKNMTVGSFHYADEKVSLVYENFEHTKRYGEMNIPTCYRFLEFVKSE